MPAERILKEDKSTSTYENLMFSKALIEEHSGKSIGELRVKIATSGFHSLRARMLAKSCGYGQVTSYGCRINPIFIPVYYLREFAAMTKTFVIDPVLGLF